MSNCDCRYEAFPHAARNCERLAVWREQEQNFPRLARLAKYILAIPVSSATSERIFSAGGQIVSHRRCNLGEEKVEDMLKIRLNISKVEAEEKEFGGEGVATDNLLASDTDEDDV